MLKVEEVLAYLTTDGICGSQHDLISSIHHRNFFPIHIFHFQT